ncbi:Amidophosphoribosyltransferase [Brevinematales bacterium NS]|nr:amidophosphoribosyltransferase [Brevinematales bacterium]QJR22759.1 Amidophosphoribosyltransferase [Brevinematales bacterium NS]
MIREECGIFGMYGHQEAARYVYLGLHFLQHRGQESCGIISSDHISLYKQIGLGKVSEFFDEAKLNYLRGTQAIGHVRYSTTGSPTLVNTQPLSAMTQKGPIALAHNGNLTNAMEIRKRLMEEGQAFSTTSDSEVILHLIARAPYDDLVMSTRWALAQLEGAFAVLVMNRDTLVAARDPHGFRPLAMGTIGEVITSEAETYVFSSEDTAFGIVGATRRREILPNEMVVVGPEGMRTLSIVESPPPTRQCVFELIYFAKPSSRVFETSVYQYRYEIGKQLAREFPVEADYVVPVPDSGIVAAIGYSEESGIPMSLGLIRSHYVGRTFIEPTQGIRDFGVRMKFMPVPEVIQNKRIVLIDDSIVRGTTSRKIVQVIKEMKPKEIHFRVASPPVKYPCFYGIDFSRPEELLANKLKTLEEIAHYIGVDSVGYVSVDGLFPSGLVDEQHFCRACFDGHYPTKITTVSKESFDHEIKQASLR